MEYNYENPLSVTSQFSFCGLPFRMDTYSGCAFGCAYCFARIRGGNINAKKLKAANPELIIKKFKNAQNSRINNGLINEYITQRVPVHFGGMSDPFQSIEKYYKSSLIVLKYLALIDYPVVISTKSTLVTNAEYLSVLKSFSNLLVQFSFSTLDEKKGSTIEPNVESPIALMNAVETLSKNGIKTAIRWQPYIPFYSEEPEDFVRQIADLGVIHLGFEHLKLPLEKSNDLNAQLKNINDIDIKKYYKTSKGINDGRELILPPEQKVNLIKQVKKIANKSNLTFGAADNEFQYLSDTSCCCSGVDQLKGFENWNKYQIAHAVKKSFDLKKCTIEFSLIENEWKPLGSIDKFINSKSRIIKLEKHNSIQDYIIDRWQNLNSAFNPTKFYNVEFNDMYDNNGMKIYSWKK
ncbi:hypothetical protein [Flavobacterium mekongense]|uniref:hypothetical protein n=1 Tax=Flavobacterium mekongense TaxID=3379707 RepID=UPI00399A54B1